MAGVDTVEKDMGFDKLVVGLEEAKGSHVDIGIFGGRNPSGQSILIYGLANEFGTKRAGVNNDVVIPERSFLRSTVDDNRDDWLQAIEQGLMSIGLGTQSTKAVLTRLGIEIRGAVSQKIRDLRIPENADSTVERKGSSNPLVDTGALRQAIEYKLGNVFDKKTGSILGARS